MNFLTPNFYRPLPIDISQSNPESRINFFKFYKKNQKLRLKHTKQRLIFQIDFSSQFDIEVAYTMGYKVYMNVRFQDEALALLETEQVGQSDLPVRTIKLARQRITILRAAPDCHTLKNWKSLRYIEPDQGNEELHRINLDNRYSIKFELDISTTPATATILGIEDYQ